MRILDINIDVDGVLCDLHDEWLRRYNRDYNDSLTPDDIVSWNIQNFTKPECGNKIFNYLNDEDLYDKSPVMAGAQEGVDRLRSAGHTITFVTSGFFLSKVEWLVRNKFSTAKNWQTAFDVIITHNKSKIRGDVMIDDYWKNLVGYDVPILFNRPWNVDYRNLLYISAPDWKHVVDAVESIAG